LRQQDRCGRLAARGGRAFAGSGASRL